MLTEAISSGELDPELTILHDAIAQRRHTLRAIQTAGALPELQPGDRVKLNCTTRPLYLHRARGTVTGLIEQQVIVALDQPTGRYRSGQLRCPPLTLDKLSIGST